MRSNVAKSASFSVVPSVRKIVSVSCVVELPLLAIGIPNETLETMARAYLADKLPIAIPLGFPGASIQVNAEGLYLGITDPK